MAKKTKFDKDTLLKYYMEYRLEGHSKDYNVFDFCKNKNIDEQQFYNYFGSLKPLERYVYEFMHLRTLSLLLEDPDFDTYDSKSKLLSYYYTIFELFTANRSFVLMDLGIKEMSKLKDMKTGFLQFINTLNLEPFDIKENRITKLQTKAVGESFFSQFLMTLKFWMDDESAGFEKTDLYIEKSVQASFQVLGSLNLEHVMDFGKFLFKEKFQD
ncbi:MAG: TetR family transcriptional regulator C-terminal domain-containing protein [Flavobacteriaceae bacterium]